MTTTPSPDSLSTAGHGLVEGGPGFLSGLRDLPRHLNVATVGAGLAAVIFGTTGPALIVIDGAQQAGLSRHSQPPESLLPTSSAA